MARYPLILKDATYVKLFQIATGQGLTLGKFINNKLNDIANQENGEQKKPVCLYDGKPAKFVGTGYGGLVYTCLLHKVNLQKLLGWKELAEPSGEN